MALPSYYFKEYADNMEEIHKWRESLVEQALAPLGFVMIDNVRFFPFPYDDFETGDFSLQKWGQTGDGAPWTISNEFSAGSGEYSAYVGPTVEHPRGTSNLQLFVDV